MFNPGRPSHPCALAVHRLTDKFLARQPRFADHAEDIRAVLRGKVLVAHNLSFDLRMLAQEFTALDLPAPGWGGRYYTMREFRARHAGQSAKLDLVLRRLDLPARAGQAHGAFEDAVLAMHVLHRLHHLTDLHPMAPAPLHNAR
ncbi:MAG: 3'-5' exonuclease [Janthinobacterium lividum]